MDKTEFIKNYKDYVSEIYACVRPELFSVVDIIKIKDPGLMTISEIDLDETSARGYVWILFIREMNEYFKRPLKINIEEVNTIDDVELFFTLLDKERILYNPESSFSEIMSMNFKRETVGKLFTEKEAFRLDAIMDKCFTITSEMNIDIYKIAKRSKLLIRGVVY